MKKLFLFLIAQLISIHSFGNLIPKRILETQSKKYESTKIYLKSGLISVLEFPKEIIEVRNGNPKDFEVMLSETSPREITLFAKSSSQNATNLIVKAGTKIFVLDLISSNSIHQDYVKIKGQTQSQNSPSLQIRITP